MNEFRDPRIEAVIAKKEAQIIAHDPNKPEPDIPDHEARRGLALAKVGLLGVAVLAGCDLAANAYNFLYTCAIENALWGASGSTVSTVVECFTENQRWLPFLAHHIK